MKNQYVCDIGDYGKYSMLNAFLEDGVKVGINWYFTDNDKTNDGKFKEYLSNEDDICKYDPVIFESLKKLYSEGRNNITEIKNSGILPDAVFYSEKLLPEKKNNGFDRAKWFQESIDQ
ncbi:MAG: hypothetical protein II695_12470, partial [Oscillospiraceae bacterium]|nr:hypothetical protein [Oscillospiraceae bacterium]